MGVQGVSGHVLGRRVFAAGRQHPERTAADAVPDLRKPGHAQPKFDARVDYDFPMATASSSSPAASPDGGHHALRHRAVRRRRRLEDGYWKMNYLQKAFKLQAFMNFLDGEATNLVNVDPAGQAIGLTTRRRSTWNWATRSIVGGKPS